jgi:hypothetical protein
MDHMTPRPERTPSPWAPRIPESVKERLGMKSQVPEIAQHAADVVKASEEGRAAASVALPANSESSMADVVKPFQQLAEAARQSIRPAILDLANAQAPKPVDSRIYLETGATPRPDAAELLAKWGYTYEPEDTVTRAQIDEYLGRRGMSVDWDELNALAVDAIERAEQYSFDSDGFAVVANSTRRSTPIFAELADAWNGRMYDADDEASAYPVGPL